MPDDPPTPGMEEILAELSAQKAKIEEMEKTYTTTIETLHKENEDLKEVNKGLQREIIKHATGTPEPPEKTPEEIAKEEEDAFKQKVVEKTLELLK